MNVNCSQKRLHKARSKSSYNRPSNFRNQTTISLLGTTQLIPNGQGFGKDSATNQRIGRERDWQQPPSATSLSQLIIIIFCALAAGAVEKQRTLLARDTDFGSKHLVDGALGVSSETSRAERMKKKHV